MSYADDIAKKGLDRLLQIVYTIGITHRATDAGERPVGEGTLTREDIEAENAAIIQQFYLDCRSKNLRPATIADYTSRLELMVKTCATYETSLLHITPEMLRSKIVDRMNRGISPHTINGTIRVAKLFGNWLVTEKYWRYNDLMRVQKLKTDQKHPPVLSPEQLHLFVNSWKTDTFTGARNRNIVLCLLDTAVRSGELRQIRQVDVDVSGGLISICHQTKSRRNRLVPISFGVAKSLSKYIHRWLRNMNTLHLFPNEDGSAMNKDRIYHIIYLRGRKLGFPVYPHLLRHTACTQMIESGLPIAIAQRVLGHADIRTTQRYAHPDEDKIMDIGRRHSVVDNLKLGG